MTTSSIMLNVDEKGTLSQLEALSRSRRRCLYQRNVLLTDRMYSLKELLTRRAVMILAILLLFGQECRSFVFFSPATLTTTSLQRRSIAVAREGNNFERRSTSRFGEFSGDNDRALLNAVESAASIKQLAATGGTATRRLLLETAATTASLLLLSKASNAAETSNVSESAKSNTPTITNKVQMQVRISRSDGTFSTRSDDDTSEDSVFHATLTLGLFGTHAPNHVAQFLRYVTPNYDDSSEEEPLPTYGRSIFQRVDQSSGLIVGGFISSLQTINLSGSTVLQYGNRIIPAPLWIETTSPIQKKLSHDTIGLLTHKDLDVSSTFGITTRPCALELDGTYTVFGKVLFDDDEDGKSIQFLKLVRDLPTYSVDRHPSILKGGGDTVEDIKSNIYTFQKDLFRSAAKTFGDSRLDKVYEGKLLRRVEVTKVSLLQ